MAANKAAAVAAGRAFAQGMVVQLQETGQQMVLRLIFWVCALVYGRIANVHAKRQMPTRPVTVTYIGSHSGSYLNFQVSFCYIEPKRCGVAP